jgi:hypothetical protein
MLSMDGEGIRTAINPDQAYASTTIQSENAKFQ